MSLEWLEEEINLAVNSTLHVEKSTRNNGTTAQNLQPHTAWLGKTREHFLQMKTTLG